MDDPFFILENMFLSDLKIIIPLLKTLEPIEKYKKKFYYSFYNQFKCIFKKTSIALKRKIEEREKYFQSIYTIYKVERYIFSNIYLEEQYLSLTLLKERIKKIEMERKNNFLKLKFENLKKLTNLKNLPANISDLQDIYDRDERKKNTLIRKILFNLQEVEFFKKNYEIFLYYQREILKRRKLCNENNINFLCTGIIFKLSYEDLKNNYAKIISLKSIKNEIINFFIEKNKRYEFLFNKTEMKLCLNYTHELDSLYDTYIIYKMKYESMFDELFEITREEYFSICQIFTVEIKKNLEKTHENFFYMENMINRLLPRKEQFLLILKKITEREQLKEKIIEFEKSASDPNRLFRSSVFLLEEERFRKSAFPSLINLENEIFKLIYEYEQNYREKFLVENKEYKIRLLKEIDERVINKNFFSGRRNRKM